MFKFHINILLLEVLKIRQYLYL